MGELTLKKKKKSLNKSNVWGQLGLYTAHEPQPPNLAPIIPCGGWEEGGYGKVQMIPPVWISLPSTVSHYVFAESGPGCLVGGKW